MKFLFLKNEEIESNLHSLTPRDRRGGGGGSYTILKSIIYIISV